MRLHLLRVAVVSDQTSQFQEKRYRLVKYLNDVVWRLNRVGDARSVGQTQRPHKGHVQ